jgi:hypothetical protein
MHANVCAVEDSAQVSEVEAEQAKRNEKKAKIEETMREAAEKKRKRLQLKAELQAQEVRAILKAQVNT